MIRVYEDKDEGAVLEILKAPGGHYMSENKVDFSGFNEVYVYIIQDDIIGFVALEIHERISQIICYVAPTMRRHGIGTQLFEFGRKQLAALDPNTIWVFFRNDVGNASTFYKNRGAKPWYAYHYMASQPLPLQQMQMGFFDTVRRFTLDDFELYLEKRAEAFYTLNQKIDSRPFDERDRRDDIKKWADKNSENIWLFFKDGELAGSLALYDGFFDELFVSTTVQGKGIGSAMVKWGLNRCYENDFLPALCVVTGNEKAIALYQKNGFETKQTLELNRFFSNNKEPDLRGPIGGA